MHIVGMVRSVGAAIAFDEGAFSIAGQGYVTHEYVAAMDRTGGVEWAGNGTRDWFYSSSVAAAARAKEAALGAPPAYREGPLPGARYGAPNVGLSASALPMLVCPPDVHMETPYYQEEFLRIYHSQEQYRGRFNWGAFLFGPWWMFFRDMPLVGLIVLACAATGSFVTAGWLAPGFLIYYFYLGFRANYLRYAALYKGTQVFVE